MSRPRISNTTIAAAILASGLAGCGVDTGNGLATVRLALTSSEPAARSGKDQQGTSFIVDAARASVESIDFNLPGGKACKEKDLVTDQAIKVHCDAAKVRVIGPFVIDLVTGTSNPSLEGFKLPVEIYERVDVRFKHSDPKDGLVPATDPLSDDTIVASGAFDYQMNRTMFDMSLRFDEDAKFEKSGGIQLEEDGAQEVLLWLDVARWFSALPITQCLQRSDLEIVNGRVAIDDGKGSCAGFETALKDAIKGSGKLEKK